MSTAKSLSGGEKRTALEALGRDALADLTEHFGLEVQDRRVKDEHVEVLVRSRSVDWGELLGRLKRAELKEICRALDLDDSGRAKAPIAERILTLGDSDGTGARSAGATAVAAEVTAAKRQQRRRKSNAGKSDEERTGSLGFEAKLWKAADLLRSNMDPSEYKHVVLGLIFLKYISDAFDERARYFADAVCSPGSEYYVKKPQRRDAEVEALREDRDEYTAAHVFWVPEKARWSYIRAQAPQPTIGKTIDDAMDAIERENPNLKGVLPKIYARPGLDKTNLGKLIDLISGIGLGSKEHQAKDTLGRVYEYFLSRFASAEGKGGGEFYTPTCVVRLLVEMLEPYGGRVYDPCCGSGGMFVQSVKFLEAHGGRKDQISVYGQESNYTTWRLARMNLAIRGIEANLGPKHADSFREDLHPDLRADFILANPPFNVSEWHGEQLKDDVRWKYGVPPAANANFAWMQHFVHHLAPAGRAGFVMANGALSSMTGGEGEIRKELIKADLVDCIVALPPQLFYSTPIPVSLWFLIRDKTSRSGKTRQGKVLLIDGRSLGRLETRIHRVLEDGEIAKLATLYHAWRSGDDEYADAPGLCAEVSTDALADHDFVLTPGRYVEQAASGIDETSFQERFAHLHEKLLRQFAASAELDTEIRAAVESLANEGGTEQ